MIDAALDALAAEFKRVRAEAPVVLVPDEDERSRILARSESS